MHVQKTPTVFGRAGMYLNTERNGVGFAFYEGNWHPDVQNNGTEEV
jgi:hypothetical protein